MTYAEQSTTARVISVCQKHFLMGLAWLCAYTVCLAQPLPLYGEMLPLA